MEVRMDDSQIRFQFRFQWERESNGNALLGWSVIECYQFGDWACLSFRFRCRCTLLNANLPGTLGNQAKLGAFKVLSGVFFGT